nr:Serpentine Receptor, class J [Caenorhabditis elegans]CCD68895.1 Serpentine Receptor, class J [Caenorhabditis elegans]|eukprot:NP_497315.1 Uncharacterized protein CELE_Y34F4.1 [Caenorhabditis elegans]
MVDLKFCFYGLSLLTGFLLHVVGVFSPCFFTYYLYSRYYDQTDLLSYGIDPGIPWGNWFKFAVFTSYLSVVCQIFVIATYVYIVYE